MSAIPVGLSLVDPSEISLSMDIVPNTFSSAPLSTCEVATVESDWGTILPLDPFAPANRLSLFIGLAIKRLIDMLGAICGLVLLSPIFVVVTFLIRRDSAGPVFFRQNRLGRYGQPFSILKFRTMRPDAEDHLLELENKNEAASGVLFKMRDDPRVTKIGHFLRRTNLDELPQLINVLKGEMSLVGPRPFQMRDCKRLRALDPFGFSRRLHFPPGLTGNWQVRRNNPTDSQHLMEFDLEYVDNWSLSRDLFLIYRTFFIVLKGFRKEA